MAEELENGPALVFFQEGKVLHTLELVHVFPKPVGIGQVLVHVVEIRQHDVAPVEEVVEGLGVFHEAAVAFVQPDELQDAVGLVAAGDAVEEVVHGAAGGGHAGTPVFLHFFGKVFPEEQDGPFAGKDETQAAEIVTACVVLSCDLSEKSGHRRSVTIHDESRVETSKTKRESSEAEDSVRVMPEALKSRSTSRSSLTMVQERFLPSKREIWT